MPSALHAHSSYSLLDAAPSPDALLRLAAEGGLTAVALTDTNALYAAPAFVKLAERHAVRPLLGAHLVHRDRRAVALVAGPCGWSNLCRILTRVHADDPADLAALLTDLPEQLHLLVDDVALAERLREPFAGRLWLELVRPGKNEDALLAAGRRLGLRAVASTAARLGVAEDARALRLVRAVRRRELIDRVPCPSPARRLLSADEMRRRFADRPDALAAGDELAALLRSDVLPRTLVLPPSPHRDRRAEEDHLRALCDRGLRQRGRTDDRKVLQRLAKELAIIEANGLASYFLAVRDIAGMARKRGRTMALRGSAGNSLVCWLLAITEVDPLRFGLDLERFLHPGRTDLPDIDLDFDWKVRDEVVAEVTAKHGAAHVARIAVHQTLQPRSAFRQAALAHGLSGPQVSELMTRLDERIDEMLLPASPKEPPLPAMFPLEGERWGRLVADARLLLGRPSHLSLHPGGIVITPKPVDHYVPVQTAAKGVAMTQFEKDGAEAIGLVKIDLLCNRALATVDEATLSSGTAPVSPMLDDPETIAMLRRGDTLGVGQLESPAMRHLLVQMRPESVEDVIRALALLRPASAGTKELFIQRRHGEPTPPVHPAVARLMAENYGLMVYEDDALRVIQALTGLESAEADRLRKRIKHRTEEQAEELRGEFMSLCLRNGIAESSVIDIWERLKKFNRYAFCKSHSVSYGLIAWRSAQLKVRHPLHFWVAALNNNMGTYPHRVYVEAIKRAGIPVRLPCVNASAMTFQAEGGGVRVGLGAIAGLPETACAAILEDRARRGPFAHLGDFRRRTGAGPETTAALVRAGAFDFASASRPALMLESRLGRRDDLFGGDRLEGWRPPDEAAERRRRDEWDALAFLTSGTAFRYLGGGVEGTPGPPVVSSADLGRHVGRLVRVQGLTATSRNVATVDGRMLQFVTLEDDDGLAEVTLFPGSCPQMPYLTIGPYVATGVVEERYGAVTLTARRFARSGEASR